MTYELLFVISSCFFFQAEDGIRDGHVTGVQTCALPISRGRGRRPGRRRCRRRSRALSAADHGGWRGRGTSPGDPRRLEIGRASCRERGEFSGDEVAVKRKRKKEVGDARTQQRRAMNKRR